VVGVLAVITVGSVFAMAGTGAASAGARATTTIMAADPAATLQSLHDTLAAQWQARDVPGMRTTQTDLTAELATLRTPAGHAAMAPDAITTLTRAEQSNDDVGGLLAAVAPARSDTAAAPTPPDTSGLAAAIQSLLSAILALVQNLLGSVPSTSASPPTS
jgi:hypothetical protein